MRAGSAVVALALGGAAVAGVYKWVDEKGKVHYGDVPPRAVTATRVQAAPGAGDVELRWYDVTGTDARALWQSITVAGPKGDDGRVFAGRTDWNLGYRYQTRVLDGQCRVTTVTTKLTVSMVLPRWRDEARAPAELRAGWQRYLRALRDHENGHRDNGVAARTEVEARVRGLAPRRDCAGIDAEAKAVANEVVARYVELDREYDRRTQHGLTQGARFP